MMDVDSPKDASGLPDRLVAVMHDISRTDELLVALDFDGTLAPEVDDPEEARATPEARAAVLRLLELPHTRVALVSGRALQSLEHVSDLPDSTLLIGSHGIELRLDGPDARSGLTDAELQRVDRLGEILRKVANSFDGAWVEQKPAGFALHTRLADGGDAAEADRAARDATAAQLDDLTIRVGKNVLEFSVRSTTKGDAVTQLREHTGATAVFFAGDDVTDEDVFRVLGADDLGLKSGVGETLAPHRVEGPADVARAIALLADLRAEYFRAT